MLLNKLKLCLIGSLLLSISQSWSQDSIPTTAEIDSIVIDTIVIRSVQNRIKNIPRGANLTNPVISFKKTKPLKNKYNSFNIPSFWDNTNKFGFTLSETAFVNWSAGGDNAVSGAVNVKLARNYKFRYIQWNNDLEMNYGLNAQEGQKLRKTTDAISLSSTFSYRRDTISNWYYSVKTTFSTQFMNGYTYPDTDTPISRFMAPGYLTFGAGVSYIPEEKKINLYLSPVTQKATFVIDQDLANSGSFGVEEATYDDDGNILTEGENINMELGFLLTNTWEGTIMENTTLSHSLSLYTDYLNSFGNIDVDWQLGFKFVINKYINTTLSTQIKYDDDTLFDEVTDDDGIVTQKGIPKIQFKQILGIALSYDF
jgi:hypothetical protein